MAGGFGRFGGAFLSVPSLLTGAKQVLLTRPAAALLYGALAGHRVTANGTTETSRDDPSSSAGDG
jgi:hypothetical protein